MNQTMSEKIAELNERAQTIEAAGIDFGDFEGYTPENDEVLNNSSRASVERMKAACGAAWLGRVNLYTDEQRARPLWKWDGCDVLNFSADFVLPAFDQELQDLILERDGASYAGTKADHERVTAIYDRIAVAGGVELHWS